MPHLTEELWQRLPGHEAIHPVSIALAPYLRAEARWDANGRASLAQMKERRTTLRSTLGVG